MGRRSLPPFQGSLACLGPLVPGLTPRAIDGRPFGALGTDSNILFEFVRTSSEDKQNGNPAMPGGPLPSKKRFQTPARSASKGGPCWRCGLGKQVLKPLLSRRGRALSGALPRRLFFRLRRRGTAAITRGNTEERHFPWKCRAALGAERGRKKREQALQESLREGASAGRIRPPGLVISLVNGRAPAKDHAAQVSRNNGFIAGAGNSPIPAREVRCERTPRTLQGFLVFSRRDGLPVWVRTSELRFDFPNDFIYDAKTAGSSSGKTDQI